MHLTDIYRASHSTVEYTFCSSAHRTLTRIAHNILGQKHFSINLKNTKLYVFSDILMNFFRKEL